MRLANEALRRGAVTMAGLRQEVARDGKQATVTIPADPRLGTRLAGYRIQALLGRGGMGVVYLAEQARPPPAGGPQAAAGPGDRRRGVP